MSVRKEAVIFVPAMTAPEKDFYLNYLSAGLTEQIESRSIKVKEVGEAKIAGSSGKSFEVYFDKEKVKTLDIYEVYWGDLFSRLSEKDLKTKILSGTHLAFYWFFSKIWASAKETPLLFISLVISLLLLIFWYYGTLVMVLTAIGQDIASLNHLYKSFVIF